MEKTIRKHILKRALAVALAASAALCWPALTPDQAWAAEKVAHIGQVQGAAQYSPYVGKDVEVQGVVTFRSGASSFYIQDPEGDGDDKTSDAILVYAPDASCGIGDLVSVSGEVTEYFNAGNGVMLDILPEVILYLSDPVTEAHRRAEVNREHINVSEIADNLINVGDIAHSVRPELHSVFLAI
jgi:hypothetical protein